MVRIVVWDPRGKLAEGTMVEGPNRQALDALEGVVSLPADPDLVYGGNAVGGYYRRGWGPGFRFERMVGARGCPMLLFAYADRLYLHWVARLIPTGPDPQGVLRLTTNTVQVGALAGGLAATGNAIDVKASGPVDAQGGWTVYGQSKLSLTSEGYLGLALYGAAKDVAVLWTAVTQSRQ